MNRFSHQERLRTKADIIRILILSGSINGQNALTRPDLLERLNSLYDDDKKILLRTLDYHLFGRKNKNELGLAKSRIVRTGHGGISLNLWDIDDLVRVTEILMHHPLYGEMIRKAIDLVFFEAFSTVFGDGFLNDMIDTSSIRIHFLRGQFQNDFFGFSTFHYIEPTEIHMSSGDISTGEVHLSYDGLLDFNNPKNEVFKKRGRLSTKEKICYIIRFLRLLDLIEGTCIDHKSKPDYSHLTLALTSIESICEEVSSYSDEDDVTRFLDLVIKDALLGRFSNLVKDVLSADQSGLRLQYDAEVRKEMENIEQKMSIVSRNIMSALIFSSPFSQGEFKVKPYYQYLIFNSDIFDS
ncbi:MAG: hypothetical protein QW292_05185 [Candidatus Parvarchaeota archaeon]